MNHKSRFPKRLLVLSLLLLSLTAVAQSETSYVPSRENFVDWLKFIRPSEQELAFERVGWRSKFWPAVQEARRLGRPILLWTMNGHPLGCT